MSISTLEIVDMFKQTAILDFSTGTSAQRLKLYLT